MTQSPNLALPFLAAGQAQKHVTVNEALRLLDGLVQLSVLDRDLTAPPGGAVDGERYIVASGATGSWAGWDLDVALRVDGAWLRLSPGPGWRAWIEDEGLLLVYNGSAWVGTTPDELQNLELLGIMATADTTNRLAVASAATLFTHAGSGHQVKVNKAGAGDTASILFQTGWSGRAEFGLSGSDDWSVKVSPDGSAWHDALIVDRGTGAVNLPNGLSVSGTLTLPAASLDLTGASFAGILPLARGGTGADTAGGARSALGLGTAAQATVVTSNTDTTTGRLMHNGSHGLGMINPRSGGLILSDWLSTSEPTGFFHLGNDTDTANKPAGLSGAGWGAGLTVRTSDIIGARFGWRGFREAAEFFMQKWDSGGWGSLFKFFHNRNILGTVAAVGGVPDGAILQGNASVSSPAGGYVERLANGFQHLHHVVTTSASGDTTVTYTLAFLSGSTPAVSITPVGDSELRVQVVSVSATAVVFSVRDGSGARVAVPAHLNISGRWSAMT